MSPRHLLPFLAVLATLSAAAGGARGQTQTPRPAAPQLAILDTDIGDDIDDAYALALVLRSPEVKLLGITTTYGDTELRARLVDRYLAAVGVRDVSVLAGPATPHDNVFSQAAYAKGGPELVYGDGVEFLLNQARVHPGQITLIAIGPLTNVEAAIKRSPESFRKLKRVVMMGGSIDRGYDGQKGERRPPDAEWNIKCDPAGAQALLASGVPIYMMPLDSTQIHLDSEERERILAHGSPLTDQLTLLYHQWIAGNGGQSTTPTLFDPVAAAYAIAPEICPTTPMRLEVDSQGYTRQVSGAPNAQVCLKSNEKEFLRMLLDRLLNDR